MFGSVPTGGTRWAHPSRKPVSVVCRKIGMVEKTFYRYREKYAGMEAAEARRLRELEEENQRLKRLLSEQILHNDALRDVLSKKW